MKKFKELSAGDKIYMWSNDFQDRLFELEVTKVEYGISEYTNREWLRINFKEVIEDGEAIRFWCSSTTINGTDTTRADKTYGSFGVGLKAATSKEEFFKRYSSFFKKKLAEFENNIAYHEYEISLVREKIERFNKLLALNEEQK